jgi:predicted dehydrogenase
MRRDEGCPQEHHAHERGPPERIMRTTVAKRIGLVGCGRWGANHFRTLCSLREEGLVSFLAVCDIDEAATAKLDADAVHQDMEEMLRMEHLDAVALVTPPDSHLALLDLALSAGLPVLIEKPFSDRHDASVKALTSLPADAVVVVGYLLRHHPGVQRLKRLIDEGRFGAIQSLCYVRETTRRKPVQATPLETLAVHGLDLVPWLLNEPLNSLQTLACELDDTSAQIEFESPNEGTRGCVQVAWQRGSEVRTVTVEGSLGSALLDFGANTLSLLHHDGSQSPPVETYDREPLEEEWRFFLSVACAGQGVVFPDANSLIDQGRWMDRHQTL